mmetsp:Transcript_37913/g.69998  ORF Transcript_37913/g.69998 Transcript_37913/m.69998 type:complete len:258 (-) Transcript_37913:182-955(-)
MVGRGSDGAATCAPADDDSPRQRDEGDGSGNAPHNDDDDDEGARSAGEREGIGSGAALRRWMRALLGSISGLSVDEGAGRRREPALALRGASSATTTVPRQAGGDAAGGAAVSSSATPLSSAKTKDGGESSSSPQPRPAAEDLSRPFPWAPMTSQTNPSSFKALSLASVNPDDWPRRARRRFSRCLTTHLARARLALYVRGTEQCPCCRRKARSSSKRSDQDVLYGSHSKSRASRSAMREAVIEDFFAIMNLRYSCR